MEARPRPRAAAAAAATHRCHPTGGSRAPHRAGS
eukprot:CAMPEP_0181384040 /NCGR_PEP_ID=MMETSP1106-20121128/21728_1 /TAXON_ID=81844 /ORGANISM="Mantoniella antarctica, Strain SL-175" /LENGTH=33 /DNA_ID= /DNA_START= /DNA_END= /DNA_ORIENTATION=